MLDGILIAGKCVGVVTKPWKSDPSKNNYTLGIAVEKKDEFGMPVAETFRVNINPRDAAEIIQQVDAVKGQEVIAKVYPSIREYNGKSWIDYRLYGVGSLVLARKSDLKAA